MKGILKFVFILNVFRDIVGLKNIAELGDGEDCKDLVFGNRTETEESSNPGPGAQITSTVYQNVKRYHCAIDSGDLDNVRNILFTTNEWRFPVQDVNLTLSYPTSDGERDYVITSMEVYLFFNGNSVSKGFVTAGGMNRDFISLEFIIPEITRLYYQFRLDGIPKTSSYQETFFEDTFICN